VRYSLDELPGSYEETIQLLRDLLDSRNYGRLSVRNPLDWGKDEKVGPYMEFANPYSGLLYSFVYRASVDMVCIVEQDFVDGRYYYPQLSDEDLSKRYDYLVKKLTTP
jgi:hypothetical protein